MEKQQKVQQNEKLKYWLKTPQKCVKATKLIEKYQAIKKIITFPRISIKVQNNSESQKLSELDRINPKTLL